MMFPNWAKNILFLLVYMISGLVLIIIIEGLISGSELLPFNTVIETLIVPLRTPILTTLVVWLTRIGDPFVLSSASALTCLILVMHGRVYNAALFASVMVLTVISLTVLKNTFQITRPISEIYHVNGWSFPSGHATVATAFFFMIAYSFVGRIPSALKRAFLIVGSITAALLVCFSRLYLGAHWGLDVLAGIALGLLTVSFTVLVFSVFVENRRSLRNRINS